MKLALDIIVLFFIWAPLAHQYEAAFLAPLAVTEGLCGASASTACGNASFYFPIIVGIDICFFDPAIHFGHRLLCFLFCLPNVNMLAPAEIERNLS